MKQNNRLMRAILCSILLLAFTVNVLAATGTWVSKTTGNTINYKTTNAPSPIKDYRGKYLTVVYLQNLAFKKMGGNSNETDVAWLLSKGYRVIELDYNNHAKAVTPNINSDIIAINDAIASGNFCGYQNSSQYRSYVLFEGYRIARDVAYFKDNPTVYNKPSEYTNGDSLYMDIIYPANPSVTVPTVLSFSYSNSYATYDGDKGKLIDVNKHQRLNLGNTLAGFNDSFLQGAPAIGVAWAIADHPKYCPWGGGKPVGGANDVYKSYQVNPDAAQKVKSAVRTLRVMGNKLGLSGKIGIYGFSRGSDAGSMAIGDKVVPALEDAGINRGTSDDVQAAVLGPGVFDFTQIYNQKDDGDGNLEYRCPMAWGELKSHTELWQSMGSAHLAETSATAPVFFFYNTDDQPYYKDQVTKFKAKLDALNVPTSTLTDYGTGHSVPQSHQHLTQLYNFLIEYLTPPSVTNNQTSIDLPHNQTGQNMPLSISPNPANDRIHISFNLPKAGNVQFVLSNISGTILYQTQEAYPQHGQHSKTIHLNQLNLPQGIYSVNVINKGIKTSLKFIVDRS